MNGTIYEVIIVGAGHAGLISSYYLKHLGLEHIIFERGRIGETWRSQRWDNFSMITMNRLNVLPGSTAKLKVPDAFGGAKEFYTALNDYVSTHDLPVLENSKVLSIDKAAGSPLFTVEVFHDNEIKRSYNCWQVIVACGFHNEKVIPAFSKNIAPLVNQLHSNEYRNASQLSDGAVLLVGSGQSGCQIAEDLIDAGKKVYISSSFAPRIPRKYRGKDILDWLIQCKAMDARLSDVNPKDPWLYKDPVISTKPETSNELSLQFLASKGAVILGKLMDASGTVLSFHSNVASVTKRADDYSESVKATIDNYIQATQIAAPEEEEEKKGLEEGLANFVWSSAKFHLEEYDIETIIWATGLTSDMEFIRLPIFDEQDQIKHAQGVTVVEGLYIMGMPWQRTRKSGLIMGVKEDAAFITTKIYSILR